MHLCAHLKVNCLKCCLLPHEKITQRCKILKITSSLCFGVDYFIQALQQDQAYLYMRLEHKMNETQQCSQIKSTVFQGKIQGRHQCVIRNITYDSLNTPEISALDKSGYLLYSVTGGHIRKPLQLSQQYVRKGFQMNHIQCRTACHTHQRINVVNQCNKTHEAKFGHNPDLSI